MSFLKDIFVLSTLFVAAGFIYAQETPLTKYINQAKGFSIDIPKSWEIKENPSAQTAVSAENPKDNDSDTFREILSISTEENASEMTLEEACNVRMLNLSNELDQYRHAEDDVLRIDNTDTHWFIYTYNKDNNSFTDLSYILIKDKHIYNITLTSLSTDFSRYKDIFRKIAESFLFLK